MLAKKYVASSSAVGPSGKGGFGRPYTGKPTEVLNEREFRDNFYLSNGISVQLVDGDAMSTEKVGHNAIYFTKEQFNVGLRFPLPSIFKEFLHYTQIPPAYIHPNIMWVLMGYNILNMLFNLNLSLLEVLFIYTIKKGKNDIFNMFAHILSLRLVINLPDSNKGGAKGHVLVRGPWAGLSEHPERDFCFNYSLKLPGREGPLGRVGGKSFIRPPKQVVRDYYHRETPPDAFFFPESIGGCLGTLAIQEKKCKRDVEEGASEKSRGSSSGPSSVKKKKKTIAQALKIVSSTPDLFCKKPEKEEDMNDLRTRFLERHRKRLHEAIDISNPATSPSWEELMEMLKGVSCFTDAEVPSTKMFDFFPLTKRVSVNMGGDPPNFVSARLPFCTPESVVEVGIRYMMCTCAQLFKWLEVAKAMRAFISHHPSGIEEMRSKLERVEADLATAQKAVADGAEMLKLAKEEKRGIRTKVDWLKKEMEAMEAKHKDGAGKLPTEEGDG
ncbi:hypothetical protein AAG906_035176 [Vitis piasezkii]